MNIESFCIIKTSSFILAVLSMTLLLCGCSEELSTEKETERYIKKNYGKDFTMTLAESDCSGESERTGGPDRAGERDSTVESEPGKAGDYKTWTVVLKENGHEITFVLRNYLSHAVQFLDGASFGPLKSRYESSYAIEKSRIVHEQVLNIVDQYADVKYIEDDSDSDRFEIYNSSYDEFADCIRQIDALYAFPCDTGIRFFATMFSENGEVIDSWLYEYSSGNEKLDMSLLEPD